MKVVVIGGKLQGVEAAYLAKKAGWEVILIDKNPEAPARGLSDVYYLLDITKAKDLTDVFKEADFVMPALENSEALTSLEQWAAKVKVPVVHDPRAYAVSSSKRKSNELFDKLKIPRPIDWPKCGFPAIAKPSVSSGSANVYKLEHLPHYYEQKNKT